MLPVVSVLKHKVAQRFAGSAIRRFSVYLKTAWISKSQQVAKPETHLNLDTYDANEVAASA